jgi:hypothetical protein
VSSQVTSFSTTGSKQSPLFLNAGGRACPGEWISSKPSTIKVDVDINRNTQALLFPDFGNFEEVVYFSNTFHQ